MARDPKKINSYFLFDFETGGFDWKKNPVTEFAGMGINGVTLEEIIKYDNLVKPYDAGLVYESIAAEKTGITKEMCEKDGIPLNQLVEDICTLAEETNLYGSKTARPILVAHNPFFDVPFLQDIFLRCKKDLSKYFSGYTDRNGLFHPSMYDTVELGKARWAEVTDTTTNFQMGSCCERAGIDLPDAHRAMNDVIALADLFRYYILNLRSGSSSLSVSNNNAVSHRKTYQW